MKILVDADACPVKNIIEEIAGQFCLEVIMVSNINHLIDSQYASVVVVDGASQSADIAIINLAKPGDIVVTQDYGLASMVMAKGSRALTPGGKIYTDENIDRLLLSRFLNQKARRAGERIKGPKKRAAQDDKKFAKSLQQIIEQNKTNINP